MSDEPQRLTIRKGPATPPPLPSSGDGKEQKVPSRAAAIRARANTTTVQELFFRIAMVLLTLASLAGLWAVYTSLLVPAQKHTRELSASVARLGAEVEEMDRRYTSGDAVRLTNEFSEAQSQLFSDKPQLERWLSDFHQQAIPLALQTNARFGESVFQSTNPPVALIPTTLSLSAQPSQEVPGFESPYQRVLRLTQNLLARQTRADLTQLAVSSGPSTPFKAELVLNLWAGEGGQAMKAEAQP